MALTNKILPGDAATVTAVEDNLSDLETLIESVKDDQVSPGAIDTRHLSGAFTQSSVEAVAGPVVLGALARIAPAALTSYPCTVGQPVYVIGSIKMDATGAPGNAYIEVQIDGAPVAQTLRQHYTTLATDWHELNTVWVFTATAATHDIELMAAGANCTAYTARLLVLAVTR